ncbi:MAG: hypothetical protein AB1405_01375 [Bdellovibrionota bacterium]
MKSPVTPGQGDSEKFQEILEDPCSDAELTEALMRLSEEALRKVWDNDQDAVYDNL